MAKGAGLVGRVSLSLWHSVSGSWPSFGGMFLGRNTKISIQGSSAKGHVVSAADFEIPPNEKGISEYSEFSLMAYVVIRLSHVFCLLVLL